MLDFLPPNVMLLILVWAGLMGGLGMIGLWTRLSSWRERSRPKSEYEPHRLYWQCAWGCHKHTWKAPIHKGKWRPGMRVK